MTNRKEDKVLGSELKLRTIKKDPKYFQKLEFREVKPEDTVPQNSTIIEEKPIEFLILPIGLK